jgi:hypothetical protein
MALNGTTVTGAGAAAQQLLTKHGYTSVQDAVDAPSQGVAKTTVYYRGGQGGAQNKSNAAYVATTYFNGASVKKLDPSLESVVPPSATLAVVVGDDFPEVSASVESSPTTTASVALGGTTLSKEGSSFLTDAPLK